MKFPLHKDERGSFQELAHKSDVEFGQLSLLKVNPNCSRGGHYHIRKREWFCCINGYCLMEMVNKQDGSRRNAVLEASNQEFILIKPFESHTVKNLGHSVCELLVIISEEYNPEDADTYKEV